MQTKGPDRGLPPRAVDATSQKRRAVTPRTVQPKAVITILEGSVTASQIENLVRSGLTSVQVPISGRGVARAFTLENVFEIALGGQLLSLGYSGQRLRLWADFIVTSREWRQLCDPSTRPTAPGFLCLLSAPADVTEPSHLPIFERSLASFEGWLTGGGAAHVIALGQLFDRIESRFDSLIESRRNEPEESEGVS